MTCMEIQSRLSPGMDGELPLLEAMDLSHHLAGCPACRRRSALLLAAREAFRAARPRSRTLPPLAVAACAAALLLALAAGRGLGREPAGAPERGDGIVSAVNHVIPGLALPVATLPAASGRINGLPGQRGRSASFDRSRLGIDCGRVASNVCIVDRPCADGRCDATRAGLGPS
jgi:anti-sigma factor RsiW